MITTLISQHLPSNAAIIVELVGNLAIHPKEVIAALKAAVNALPGNYKHSQFDTKLSAINAARAVFHSDQNVTTAIPTWSHYMFTKLFRFSGRQPSF
jgi:hypothetical protein